MKIDERAVLEAAAHADGPAGTSAEKTEDHRQKLRKYDPHGLWLTNGKEKKERVQVDFLTLKLKSCVHGDMHIIQRGNKRKG